MFLHPLRLRPLVLACALLAGLVSGPLAAAGLVPHRAVYSIKLDPGWARAGIVDARGRVERVLEKTCDGWIMTQEITLEMDTIAGGVIGQDSRFAGWESLDGKSYRFSSRKTLGKRVESFKGEVKLGADGKWGRATFEVPAGKSMALPKYTLFPAGQTAWLIERALAGSRQLQSNVFYGTDGQGPREVTAYIGPRVDSGQHGIKKLGALVQRPGWNIQLVIFFVNNMTSTPTHEMFVLQLDNGVAPRVVLNFPRMNLIMTMEKVEAIPLPSC